MRRFEFLRFMSTAIITAALAAAAHAGSPEPGGGTDSYLLVGDFGRDQVLRYDEGTGDFVETFVPRRSGGLNQPWGVLFGPHDQNLYVSSGEFGGPGQLKAVLRYDGATGAFIDNFAIGGDLKSPRGIIFGQDGNLYVADHSSTGGRVARFDGTTGAYLGNFVALGSGGLSAPTAAVFGPDSNDDGHLDLYVGSFGTDSILHYDGTSGAFLGAFVASGSGGLAGPGGMSFGPDGNLYVARYFSDQPAVLRFQGPGGAAPGAFIDTFIPAGSGGLRTCFFAIFGPDGNGDEQLDLYVADSDFKGVNGKRAGIKRYDGVTGAFIDTFVAEGSGGFDDPGSPIFTHTDPVTLQYLGGPTSLAASHAVPEPSCLLLGSIAAAGLALYGWRRRERVLQSLGQERL
jgi:DNA-binding beta-propeller fold protein YncE